MSRVLNLSCGSNSLKSALAHLKILFVEMDKTSQVVKKLKLTGAPYKIFKKTAFIKVKRVVVFNKIKF